MFDRSQRKRAHAPGHRPWSGAAAGFSLVELALSIGIIAFAFVPLFSLLPAGMGIFREAVNTSVSSQILQKVLADARQSDFAQLVYPDTGQPDQIATQGEIFRAPTKAAPELRYFDDQGDEVVPSNSAARRNPVSLSPAERLKIVYHVNTRIVTNAMLPAGAKAAGATAALAQYLATVTVQVAVNPGNQNLTFGGDALFTPTRNVTILTYSAQVAKND